MPSVVPISITIPEDLTAKNVKSAKIPCQLIKVIDTKFTSDEILRTWVRQFNVGQTNYHYEAQSGWPAVLNGGLAEKVTDNGHEKRRFTIRILCDDFPHI